MKRALIFVLAASALLGQAVKPSPKYSVAIVTPNDDRNARPGFANIPPGPWKVVGVTLRDLIEFAYLVPAYRILEGPDWLNTERWNFHLQIEPVVMSNELYAQALLQALEDRFQLKAHRESRILPIYEMTLVNNGSKLREVLGPDSRGRVIEYTLGSIQLRDSSIDSFADLLSVCLGRPVVNKTGKSGEFYFTLRWSPSQSEIAAPHGLRYSCKQSAIANDANAPPILDAVEDQLGLRLVSSEGPVEVIVIDHARKPNPR